MDLKKTYVSITANRAQAAADFVRDIMGKVEALVEEMESGTEYSGYIELGSNPNEVGLGFIGDLILKEGLKYSLENEIVDGEDNYALLISIAHIGE